MSGPLACSVHLPASHSMAAATVAAKLEHRIDSRLKALGIPRRCVADVVIDPAQMVPAIWIDGVRLRYARQHRLRARMHAERRLLHANEVDHTGDLARAPSPELASDEIAALVDGVVSQRPQLLIDDATAAEVVEELGLSRDPHAAQIVQFIVTQGHSLEDRIRLATALDTADGDAERALVSMPPMLSIEIPRVALWRLLREDPNADHRPFVAVHVSSTVPLPAIRLVTVEDVPEGCARVRVNDLLLLEQPLLPIGHVLAACTDGANPVHVVAWGRNAQMVACSQRDPNSWSTWEYLAVEVHDALRTHASRLIDRCAVDLWCEELSQPVLIAALRRAGGSTALVRVLRRLVDEQVPIPDLGRVVQRMIDHRVVEGPPPRRNIVLTQALPIDAETQLPAVGDRVLEHVRHALGATIYDSLVIDDQPLPVITLGAVVEEHLTRSPTLSWLDQLTSRIAEMALEHHDCALLVSVENRTVVRNLLADILPNRAVLSFQELPASANLRFLDEVALATGKPDNTGALIDPTRGELAPLLASVDGTPIAPLGVSLAEIATAVPLRFLDAFRRRDEWVRDDAELPDNLATQGWGLIVPEGERGKALEEALNELTTYRLQIQGATRWVRRVPPDMNHMAADNWVRGTYEAELEHLRPRYLLILGDLHEVSLELQQVLSPLACVGRLAFDDLEDYRRYAAKVVRCETVRHTALATFGFCSQDGSVAAEVAQQYLYSPLMTELRALSATPGAYLAAPQRIGGGKKDLIDAVGQAGLLLTVTHGVGGKMPYPERVARQGELVLRRADRLTAEDVRETRFLPGGIWFMFACYGAGTPRTSAFLPWVKALATSNGPWSDHFTSIHDGMLDDGERPFVAALPKRALANPLGPIAIIAHVDLAWSYSFYDHGQPRAGRLLPALRVLLRQQLAGFAHEQIMRPCALATARLADLFRQNEVGPAVDKEELLRAWILREDLRGFMVLGDPAARMRLPPKTQGASL